MRPVFRSVVLFQVCVFSLIAAAVTAQDWPQWRGPNRDAKASSFNVPVEWPAALTQKWQVEVGDGVATPCLVGDRLYVFTREDSKEIVRCLNATSGDEVWGDDGYEVEPTTGGASGFPGPRSTPVVADGKIVTLGARGMLSCLDAESGELVWRKDDFNGAVPQFFVSCSPILVDGLCIAQLGNRENGGLVAYDLHTGEERWRMPPGRGPSYASPVVMEIGGTNVVFAPTDEHLVAVDAANGKLLWETQSTQGRYNATTPIVDGQTLVFAGPGTGITALKFTRDGDQLNEERVWESEDNQLNFNSPVLTAGLLFGLSNRDQLFCIDTGGQRTAWTAPFTPPAEQSGGEGNPTAANEPAANPFRLVQAEVPQEGERRRFDRGEGRGRPGEGGRRFGGGRGGRGGRGGGGYGSIVDAGAVLLAITPAASLVVFEPTDDSFREVARYKVAERGTYAYPIPVGNRIYIKDQNAVTMWTVE